MSGLRLISLCRTEPVAPDLPCADQVGDASKRKVLRMCGWRPFTPSQRAMLFRTSMLMVHPARTSSLNCSLVESALNMIKYIRTLRSSSTSYSKEYHNIDSEAASSDHLQRERGDRNTFLVNNSSYIFGKQLFLHLLATVATSSYPEKKPSIFTFDQILDSNAAFSGFAPRRLYTHGLLLLHKKNLYLYANSRQHSSNVQDPQLLNLIL
jgi:hypothetical protein